LEQEDTGFYVYHRRVGLFIAASGGGRFGYWLPTLLLVVIVLSVANNYRIDRLERERH
jgi:hypothetical protein